MRNRGTIWANIGLALLAPMVFFAILEVLLLFTGLRPLALTEDPMVGFASTQPLFVEKDTAGRTMMVTNPVKLTHFNAQSFPRRKSPGTYRIFTLGGSTTYGHPWRDPVSYTGWLRELLPAADSGRKWEVINAGGISYASYREAKLVEELSGYQPDLFIVYSGHNEFLEERTYRGAARMPTVLRNLSGWLDRTRTYTALRVLLRKAGVVPGESAAGKPSDPGLGAGPHPADPAGGRPRLAGEVDDVLAKTIGPTSYHRDDSLKQGVLRHYRASLERMARLARAADAQILFVTTPVNEKDCSPFKSEYTPGMTVDRLRDAARWDALAKALEDSGRAAQALPWLDSLSTADPRNAGLRYRAGRAALAAGDFARAKSEFTAAVDEDVCPLRALSPMRDIVREVARGNRAHVFDFTGTLEARSLRERGHAALGEPEFVDHVHLSIAEYRGLARGLMGWLADKGELTIPPDFDSAAAPKVERRVMAAMGPRELGEGLHNLAKVINWAGKHADAARIAESALRVDSTGLEAIWSSLFVGAAREREGKGAEAIVHYRRAVSLDSLSPLSRRYLADALERNGDTAQATEQYAVIARADPSDLESRVKLAKLYLALGRPQDALPLLEALAAAAPANPVWQQGLGEALLAAGRAAEAEARFRRVLEMDPRAARAVMGLGRIAEAGGNRGEAISLFARALALDPSLQEANAALGRNLRSMQGQ